MASIDYATIKELAPTGRLRIAAGPSASAL